MEKSSEEKIRKRPYSVTSKKEINEELPPISKLSFKNMDNYHVRNKSSDNKLRLKKLNTINLPSNIQVHIRVKKINKNRSVLY
jgi:hypothetical protein